MEGDPGPLGFEVVVHDADALAPGTTVFADGSYYSAPRIVEVDSEGRVLWQHLVPHDRHAGTSVMDAAPLPGGSVLYSVDGVGVFEVDRDDLTTWSYLDARASHDVDRLDDGSTLITNGWAAKGVAHFFEVDADGEETWSWDGVEAYDHPPYDEVYAEGWIHANSAQRLPDGTTLACLRNFHTVALLDRDGAVLWDFALSLLGEDEREHDVAVGHRPHGAELTAAGTVLLTSKLPTMVYEVDPEAGEVVWQWDPALAGIEDLRDVNRLDNGNTLVVSAWTIVEVDETGAVLWELHANGDPVPGTRAKPFFKAVRLAPDGTAHGD